MLIQTPDKHQKWLTDLLPVQQGLANTVHSICRITVSTMPCGHTFDVPSETKQITGVFSPLAIRLYRLEAALVVLLSTHPEVRLPGLTISHVRLEYVFLNCGALHRARQ